MKGLINTVLLVSLIGCVRADLSMRTGFSRSMVQQVAVLPFYVTTNKVDDSMGGKAANLFSAELLKADFHVLDSSQTVSALQGELVNGSMLVDPAQVIALGRQLGVDTVVFGVVAPGLRDGRLSISKPKPLINKQSDVETNFDHSLSVSTTMISVATGQVLWIGHAQYEGVNKEASMRTAIRSIAKRLRKELLRSV